MKVEIDLDVADSITLQSLIRTHQTLSGHLRQYKEPDHGWIAISSTDKKEDVKAIKKMKKALELIINEWYGGDV